MTALRIKRPAAGGLYGAGKRVREWQVWTIPAPAGACIFIVIGLAVSIICSAALHMQWSVRQLGVFAALISCGIIAIESARTVKEVHGAMIRDLQAVWHLAIAVVLPPFYALAAPVPLLIYKLWRQPGVVIYRRVYSNATLSIAYGAASLIFHLVPPVTAGPLPGAGGHALAWTGVVAGCGALAWSINVGLLVVAMRLETPGSKLRELGGNREGLVADLIELTLGISFALVVAINSALMALALPSVVLYRRYLMQAQLVAQSRIDSKTGVLKAATWQREAEIEFFRARRGQVPLALIMIDIDHFRSVNETAGIQAGDQVLRSIARMVDEQLYGRGVVGRLGGEEFVILLPQTTLDEARRLAERLRDHIAAEPIAIETGSHAGFVFRLTVSMGVAALAGSRRALAELVDGVSAALSEAKATGRNRVCVEPEQQAGAA